MKKVVAVIFPLFVLWGALYLWGLARKPMSSSLELRRALGAREMSASDLVFILTLRGEVYLNKPPLFYQLLRLSYWFFGRVNDFSARFPSALSALLVAVAITAVTLSYLDAPTALCAGVILLLTPLFWDKGTVAEENMFNAGLISASLLLFFVLVERGFSGVLVWGCSYLFLGLAFSCKGPLCLTFFFPTVAGFLRR